MSDDDWVARLLSEAERPSMPQDVADRLEQGLRRHLDEAGPDGTATPDGDEGSRRPGSPDGTPPPERAVSSATEPAADPAGPVPAAGSVPATAVVPPAAGAGVGAAPLRAGADDDGGRTSGDGPVGADGPSRTDDGRTFGAPRREQRSDAVGERRRRLLTRWVPVAAGVLVLGAAGAAAVNVLGGGSDSTAESAEEVAAADVAESVAPRSLVATGTEYTTADVATFEQQVRDLVALAATGTAGAVPSAEAGAAAGADAVEPAEPGASALTAPAVADPSAARASVAGNPLADATALRECVQAVTDGTDEEAAAVDLALVNGVESTLVVVPDPAGVNLFVYVVGPDCTGLDDQFQFFTVAP